MLYNRVMLQVREVPAEYWPTQDEVQAGIEGFRSVAHLNADIPMSEGYRGWVVHFDSEIIGYLSVQGHYPTANGDVAEIGVNFWAGPTTAKFRAIDEWGKRYLRGRYFALTCRILPHNQAMKRVVERFGFDYMGEDPATQTQIHAVLLDNVIWLR